MKYTQNEFTDSRKSLFSILASKILMTAPLTCLALLLLPMVACDSNSELETPVVINVEEIEYSGSVEAGDNFDSSNIKITLAVDKSPLTSLNPKDVYDYLKEKEADFSLSIKITKSISGSDKEIISISNQKTFPSPASFRFDEAGLFQISISGKINGRQISMHDCYVEVESDKNNSTDLEKPDKHITEIHITQTEELDAPKTIQEILDVIEFTIVYSDEQDTYSWKDLPEEIKSEMKFFVNENDISIDSANNPFLQEYKAIELKVVYKDFSSSISNIENGNYIEQDDQTIEVPHEMQMSALKNIFGISEDLTGGATSEIKLTAQIIKVLGDISSDPNIISKKDIKAASEGDTTTLNALRETYGITSFDDENVKNALCYYNSNPLFVKRKENKWSIENKYGYYLNNWFWTEMDEGLNDEGYSMEKEVDIYEVSSTDKKTTIDGDFYYNDIRVEFGANTSIGDNYKVSLKQKYDKFPFAMTPKGVYDAFSNAIGSHSTEEALQKKILIERNYKTEKLPTLDFQMETFMNAYAASNVYSVISLYKAYCGNYDKLKIKCDLLDLDDNITSIGDFNGKVIANFQMFIGNIDNEDGIPNISADTLVKVNRYCRNFSNLIITGNFNEAESEDINSIFTNIIFEGDVSGIKNNRRFDHAGVIYFKDKPYFMDKWEEGYPKDISVNGVVKFGKLINKASDVGLAVGSGTVDFRDLSLEDIKDYNMENSVYRPFHGIATIAYYPSGITTKEEPFISSKFTIPLVSSVSCAYSGDTNIYYYENISSHIGSKHPRSLAEFEFYGNNGYFEKSAKSSYTEYEFEKLSKSSKESLTKDEEETGGKYQLP